MITSLYPIEPSDVPELVRVHSAAFKTDQFSNFMLNGKPTDTHERLMERTIQSWISDPTSWMFEAVNEDGLIVGWTCWLTKEKQPSSDKPASKPTSTNYKSDTPSRTISQQMRNDSTKWEADLMTDAKYVVLQALATHPDYQRLGIGFKLIEQGVKKADEAKLACWCQASPVGSQLYSEAGFRTLGSNEYDLGEFGKYTFRYMIRRLNSA